MSTPSHESREISRNDSTSSSLLQRAIGHEAGAWERLVSLYSPLVRHWCRQAKVPETDLLDVSQEIFAAIAAKLPSYQADRPGTRFRAWMRGIARHKIQHYFEDRGERGDGGTDAKKRLEETPDANAQMDLSEEPRELDAIYHRALELVRAEFEDRTWAAFWQVTVEERMPAEVAAEMGVTANAVRQAKARVLRRLKQEMGELID